MLLGMVSGAPDDRGVPSSARAAHEPARAARAGEVIVYREIAVDAARDADYRPNSFSRNATIASPIASVSSQVNIEASDRSARGAAEDGGEGRHAMAFARMRYRSTEYPRARASFFAMRGVW